jgi:hypothetical protein
MTVHKDNERPPFRDIVILMVMVMVMVMLSHPDSLCIPSCACVQLS